jgi:uncharacterized surface protein with fasciclin (FAS1) repeats
MRRTVIGALVAVSLGLGVMATPVGAHDKGTYAKKDRHHHADHHERDRGHKHAQHKKYKHHKATYHFGVNPVPHPATDRNMDVDGTVRLKALPNYRVQVKVRVSGLAPNLPHAQHMHGDLAGGNVCPGPEAAGDDGLISTPDGVPFYGGIQLSLTTTGDTSPASGLAVDRFPVADQHGNLHYNRTITVSPEVHKNLGKLHYVVHGIDLDGDGAYDFDPFGESPLTVGNPDLTLPFEATIPAGCGELMDGKHGHDKKGHGKKGQPVKHPRPADRTLTAQDQAFLVAAAQIAFAEIEQGRVATQRGVAADVRQFGHHLVVDHFNQLVAQLPLHEKYRVPIPGATAEQVAALAALVNAPADDFDVAFLELQVVNHEQALALFTAAAEGADNPKVRQFAAAYVPILAKHLEVARALLESITPLGTIVDIAVATPELSTLVTAVTAAGLAPTLAGEGPFTVFAPTNAAFAALPEGTLEALLADPTGALAEILQLHVIAGAAVDSAAAVAAAGTTIETLGGPVRVELVGDTLTIGGAAVIMTDIVASNGIIHVIDAVITEPAMAGSMA